MKKRIERARIAGLLIVVGVAIIATVAATVHDFAPLLSQILAGVSAVGAGVLPSLRPRWSGTSLKNWTRARSVSEQLKTDVYLWLAQTEPYEHDPDAHTLRDRTDKLFADAADLRPLLDGIPPEVRAVPPVHDPRSYFAVRWDAQYRKYYRPKVTEIVGLITRYRRIEIGLGVLGAVIGLAAAITGVPLAAWIAVVATASTAFAVHVSASRYEFQRIEFSRTAEELRQIGKRAEEAGIVDVDLRALVVRAENVISVENQGWMAKLSEDPPDQTVENADQDKQPSDTS